MFFLFQLRASSSGENPLSPLLDEKDGAYGSLRILFRKLHIRPETAACHGLARTCREPGSAGS